MIRSRTWREAVRGVAEHRDALRRITLTPILSAPAATLRSVIGGGEGGDEALGCLRRHKVARRRLGEALHT